MKNHLKIVFLYCISGLLFPFVINSQTEVMAWSNITGIRIEGQLIEFESNFRVVGKNGYIKATGKEKQHRPSYDRVENKQIVNTTIDQIRFSHTVEDRNPGEAEISLRVLSDTTYQLNGVYYCIELPDKYYKNATILIQEKNYPISQVTQQKEPTVISGNTLHIQGEKQTFQLNFRQTTSMFFKKESGTTVTLYIPLIEKSIKKGEEKSLNFVIRVEGEIDHNPVNIKLDVTNPGRLFEGLGGNFRLQNPRVDPQVINYCLDSLRVAWGRVELPWRNWHPEEDKDPIQEAYAGNLDPRVKDAMQMAQRLAAIGMPVIVSAWFPPTWAIDGDPAQYVRRGGVQAFRLSPAKEQKIYKSITDYLVYLKNEYGVEAIMYSFNESDLGIDVLHTPEEHAHFIKGLGKHMASRGLSTKLLLGDNSDATTFDFVLPAMKDKDTHPYIGAISFHSWRGCDDETLHKWADASRELNIPLLVGEGSTDAAAHVYPKIFAESTFALYEINLYMRICAICQPLSILQWQLTSDYSVLWGGGVYGSDGPLRPTQRFWNLKQLASTPESSFAIPFTCDKEEVNCAAFANIARGQYTVHMVNNGASRRATIQGKPSTVKTMDIYVTNEHTGMKKITTLTPRNGVITLELPPMSFVSVINR